MPTVLYCWRCARDVPMLTDEEWLSLLQRVSEASNSLLRQLSPSDDTHVLRKMQIQSDTLLAGYNELTGAAETNVNAVWHHPSGLYGPPCRHCGVILRTRQAKYCFRCHRNQEEEPAPL